MAPKSSARPFKEYSQRYSHIKIKREDGIIELSVHTNGDSLKWGGPPHEQLGFCFLDVANDPDNKVVIITGEGDDFCTETDISSFGEFTPRNWAHIHQESKRLLNALMDIEIPVIGAANGPAHIHSELLILSNIVLASETATFQDAVHFTLGVVPGDGVHVAWPAVLGPTRGSYFLLTGQKLSAHQAMDWGVVNEVLPKEQVKQRAWDLAREIAAYPPIARRYSRVLLVHEMRRMLHEQLSHGLALEGLALQDHTPSGQ
jgi:enoyl-CoA hydratase/carnithine racemase